MVLAVLAPLPQQGTSIMANSMAYARGIVYCPPAKPAITDLPSDSGGTDQGSGIGLVLIPYFAISQKSSHYIFAPETYRKFVVSFKQASIQYIF